LWEMVSFWLFPEMETAGEETITTPSTSMPNLLTPAVLCELILLPSDRCRQADLFSISKATDIHGSKFDSPANPIAVGGVLDSSITAAEYVSFVNYIDPVQLARFGLHNGKLTPVPRSSECSLCLYHPHIGKPNNPTLIDAKWESLALAPTGDLEFPDDYFLFTAVGNSHLLPP